MFKVSEFSKLFNINTSVLRYYDKEGIFSPEYRDPKTGYRYYTASQINAFTTIMAAKEGGIPFSQIHSGAGTSIQLSEDINEIKRRHELFKFFLDDHSIAHDPIEQYQVSIKTFPAFPAYKKDAFMEGPRDALKILTEALHDLTKETLRLDCINLSFIEFHSHSFSYHDNSVSLYLFVKESDHPKITYVPRQRYLCTYHYDSIKKIGNAYKQLRRQARDRNLSVIGNPSERYIRKVNFVPGEEEYFTELRLPLNTR